MSGIYIHVPFCATRCIYCSFYSTTQNDKTALYVNALCKEIALRSSFLDKHDPIRTIYFGGGTPSQLSPGQIHTILNCLNEQFDLSQVTEVTMEANPEDMTPAYLEELVHAHCIEESYQANCIEKSAQDNCIEKSVHAHCIEKSAQANYVEESAHTNCIEENELHQNAKKRIAINRISMGVQSFNDDELHILHRRHSAARAKQAVEDIHQAGIHNISIDLMYGLPHQTQKTWQDNINQALSLDIQHLSAYCLSIESDTALERAVNKGLLTIADEEQMLLFSSMLRHQLKEAGFEQYEISNFAKPGFYSRHNSSYWDATPYLGLGPGAHSYNGKSCRQWNESNLADYLAQRFETSNEHLTLTDRYNEMIMLRLRTRRGIPLADLHALLKDDPSILKYFEENLPLQLQQELVIAENEHIRLTEKGLDMANAVIRDLFY